MKRTRDLAFALAITIGIFIGETLTREGYAEWLLYVIPLLIATPALRRPYIHLLPSIGTILIILGFFLSPPGGDISMAVINRVMGVLVLWTMSFIVIRRKQAQEALELSYKELERRVEERTDEITQANALLQNEVAERKRAEEELKQSTHKLELILKSAGEGIFGLNKEGNCTFINSAAATMLGYRAGELIGKHSHSLFHHVRPDGMRYPEEECKVCAAFRYGTTQHIDDEIFIRKDGARLPVEYISTPIFEGDEILGAVVIFSDITERKRAEEKLQRAYKDLSSYVSELEQNRQEVELLSEMGSLLQACSTAEEAYAVIDKSIRKLFPLDSGAIYLFNTARDILEAIVAWGPLCSEERTLSPNECWALRLGRIYQVDRSRPEIFCPHVQPTAQPACICVPMTAQNETIGLLHLCIDSSLQDLTERAQKRLIEHKQRVAIAVAESIALLLSNLRLRETLYSQSIHDPLTGLLNRRSLEELLQKELHRAARKSLPLGIIMLDIDHFKEINDTFGHDAGDMILRTLGELLQTNTRAEDFACRYGGEEFIIVMPETPLSTAQQRAEELRQEVRNRAIRYQGQSIGTITVSLGVAARPEHGTSANELFLAADSALYQAKAGGRDRVATV